MAFDFSKLKAVFGGDAILSSKRSFVGLDVGSTAIKIVQLNDNKGVPTLETYGELQLGPYANTDIGRTTHLPPQKLAEAFVDILREASATATRIGVALSYNSSFSTTIFLPTTDSEKIKSMIPVEAKKFVPVSLNEVTLDWFPISTTTEVKGTKVLLVAIHNDALKRYEGTVKGAGLSAEYNELEMFSAIRSSIAQEDDAVALIDFGGGSTKLYLVHKGAIGITHSVLMSGVELTTALASALSIDFRSAEERKRRVGLSDASDPRVAKAIAPILERGFSEIYKAINQYEKEEGIRVEKIVMVGSGALLSGLSSYVGEMFARTVTIADPFSKVAYPAFLEDTLKEAGPAFAVALGTALRSFIRE